MTSCWYRSLSRSIETEKNPGVLGLPTANHTCQHDKYACGDGACIPVNWVCNGEVDCKNDMDEQNCDHPTTCSGGAYQCSSGACVPHRWHCDGKLDCNDGSDEENCTSTGTRSELPG
uniref:Uncharacterized protein n=1 Tax=Magallana gigas TaxID=29159 RepID=A0A8W8MUI3_MAGGI